MAVFRIRILIFFCSVFWILCNYALLTTANLSDGNGNTTTNSPPPPPPPATRNTNPFKPGIAVIVATLTTLFSIVFLLLLYVKHCRRSGNTYANNNNNNNYPVPVAMRKNSGINRKVIESLPIFRFSSLRGQKDGLECAVCLNRFDSDEVLRLLPKCKHAFHVECVDTWLDAHSTCPLCRYRVDPEDVLLIDFSNQTTPRGSEHEKAKGKGRISGRHSSAGENGSSLEIIVEAPAASNFKRSSFDSWNSKRNNSTRDSWKTNANKSAGNQGGGSKSFDSCSKASRKDGQLPVLQKNETHRVDHRIIISDGREEEEGRRRWSDAEAVAEVLYLKTEMIMDGKGVINGRSVSDMTGMMSRYDNDNDNGREERERQEEGVAKRWLAWISQSQQQQQNTAVHSDAAAAAARSSTTNNSAIVV